MKRLLYLSAFCMVAMSSCNNAGSPKLGSGIDKANMDTTANPKTDFYQYACGGWMKNNPLKPEDSRFGTFDMLRDSSQAQVKRLIEELATQTQADGSVGQKIGTMYKMGMDSVKLNAEGFEPVKAELQAIADVKDTKELQAKMAELHLSGVNPMFGLFGEADFKNSKMNIAWLYQGGLGMGERDYYIEEDAHSKDLRDKYKTLIANLLDKSGAAAMLGGKTPQQLADVIMAIETRLAKASMSRLDQRDPHKIYNIMTVEDLQKQAPNFDFKAYFTAMGVPALKTLNVAQPAFIKEVDAVIKSVPVQDLKAYFAWMVLNNAASYLNDEAAAEKFAFYGKAMSGKEEMKARWKRVIDVTNGSLGEAVGQIYVAKYFPAESKERMLKLVKNLQVALGERIKALDWMSDSTKQRAQEKLDAFRIKIGYPDKWRDYSSLEIKSDSYYANVVRADRFATAYSLSKIDKPLDPTEWGMTPQTVNAYYNPTTNEITFPAAILQPPFFNAKADDAANYGAIGVVIGHEMTHGFDDQGCQYDKEGNLTNWWTASDAEQFANRTKVLSDYFDAIEVAAGVHANGKFTLGENIADFGGLQVSWVAMQKAIAEGSIAKELDGFNVGQRFFLAYANVWAGNIREKEILRLTKEDPHSLGRWRVDGTLKHIPQFYETFDIKEGDGMYIAPDKRAVIW